MSAGKKEEKVCTNTSEGRLTVMNTFWGNNPLDILSTVLGRQINKRFLDSSQILNPS